MLCLAQVALTPLACASFSIPMICSSLNLLFISFCSFYLSRTTLCNCPAFGGQAKMNSGGNTQSEEIGIAIAFKANANPTPTPIPTPTPTPHTQHHHH